MKFIISNATFMSHVITTDGLLPSPVTVQAVVRMSTRTENQGVRRFMGAINYLSKLCPQLSIVIQPLLNFTKMPYHSHGHSKHHQALDEAKILATSTPCLTYYDVNTPMVLQVVVLTLRTMV